MNVPRIIARFVEVAPAILRAHFRKDSCLNASRVTIEALAAFGIRATAMSVDILCFNKAFDAQTKRLGRIPHVGKDTLDEGAWAMGIDRNDASTDAANNAWCGHLVVIAQDFLIDASARQFDRPEKNIRIPDIIIAPVSRRFMKGKGNVALVTDDDSAEIIFFPFPEDQRHMDLMPRGFSRHANNLEVAKEIVDAMNSSSSRTLSYDFAVCADHE